MPYQFEFDRTNEIAHCRFDGEVTDDCLKRFYVDAGRRAALIDPKAAIVDFTSVTVFDVSVKTLIDIAKLPPAMRKAARPRVVVAPAPFIFGMMRTFEIIGGRTRPNLRVVGTPQEARALLGILEPRFEPC